jgi:hypothetical protein
MLGHHKRIGFIGTCALVGGMLLFFGKNFSANWVRWTFGPLLWFAGCALLISWALSFSYADELDSSRNSDKSARHNQTNVAKKAR